MKIRFLKHHLKWNVGDEADLDDGIAGYLILIKVATIEGETQEATEEKLAKKLKTVKKK